MKTLKFLSAIVLTGSFAFLTSCESNPEVESQQDLLPPKFRVEIPSSISTAGAGGRIRINGRSADDSIHGNEMYRHLGTFIAVGKGASEIVEGFIHGIRKHKINRVTTMTFISEDDNRAKNLVVTADAEFEGQVWDHQLTITDADSESADDGGKALQIFWNQGPNVDGIAIIKPYNCDRAENANAGNAMFRIDYKEAASAEYDAQMEVQISGLPLADPSTDPYSMSTLHMFAGKKGDVIDVFGNSNHPNAVLFSGPEGFNWAFVASSEKSANVAVAEVGLPPSDLDTDDRSVMIDDYSVMNVFVEEITAAWPGIDQAALESFLSDLAAPAYFESRGFLTGGVSPGPAWDALEGRLENLTPYNPKETSALTVTFK